MKLSLRYSLMLLCLLVSCVLAAGPVWAAPPKMNIATTLSIADKEAVDGDIMSLAVGKEDLVRSAKDFDERMYGVLVKTPLIVYRTNGNIPVVHQGNAEVNVTTISGPIAVGDYVTSSEITGKGMKAGEVSSGYMLGIAMTALGEKEGSPLTYKGKQYRQGRVVVTVGVGPASPVITKASGGLLGTLKQIAAGLIFTLKTSKQLDRIIRYLIALVIIALTLYFSFRTFGRNITKGIEGIGRNPLAKNTIQMMIIVNSVFLGIVVIAGVALALAIISL